MTQKALATDRDRLIAGLVFIENFREWYANHFEDFSQEINAELLCLDNQAARVEEL
jgi:hypothetical protein